eukprot:321422-Lingulodinium_polyedra.AAC.1
MSPAFGSGAGLVGAGPSPPSRSSSIIAGNVASTPPAFGSGAGPAGAMPSSPSHYSSSIIVGLTA